VENGTLSPEQGDALIADAYTTIALVDAEH
jgi:hypothetical protein